MPDLDDGRPSPLLKFHNLDSHIMDLDLDLDSPWPSLDQISMSPFLISSSTEQPCSPLWAFSDSFDEKLLPAAAAAVNGGIRLPDYSRLLTCNHPPNMESKPTEEDGESRNHPSSFAGLENLDRYGVIKQRMAQALRYFKESTDQPQHVLAQVWAPVKNGNRYFLTTSGQPFVLDPSSGGLHGYRLVSLMYMFSVDGENEGELGLPGRVFKQKVPEWTPDVQYYSSKEYSRLSHALHYNVHGTLALPVFEPTGKACVAVLELILTSQKINYAPEVDKVCKALEAVNLKSSEILDHSNTQVSKDMVFVDNMICNEGRHIALEEILEILTLVCETHKLPLAQTWVPCRHRSVIADGGGLKKSCSSFDGSCMGQICMSTTDVACYLVDAQVWGFRDACLEHHLQKGQGVAGRAFLSHGSCFCGDITQFCKTQYPLVHYARMFKLTGCFAICLRSGFTGNDEYVLEFFLPLDKTDSYEQHALLRSLLATMKQHMKSLWVASGKELDEEEMCIEIIEASSISERLDAKSPEPVQKLAEVPYNGVRDMDEGNGSKEQQQVKVSEAKPEDNDENNAKAAGNENVVSCAETKPVKKSEKKRGKAEKQISLDVLQHYFAGSLKDAAKSLGVCPTTMKRICRQHGISRWPSRKINKVNRSLSKLKRVIESVQGTEEALGLGALSTSPLPIAVGSISWPSSFKGSNEQSPHGRNPPEPLTNKIQSPFPKTPGSEDDAGPNHLVIRRFSSQDQLVYEGAGPETLNISKRVKTGSSSREESSGSPTSHGSSNNGNLPNKEPNFPVPSPIPNGLLTTELQEPFGGMLIEDAGSSKDLRDLDRKPESSWTKPNPNPNVAYAPCAPPPFLPQTTSRQELKSVTIKASYREDIIRFRISVTSNMVELKEQVAKRLKLEVGTFEIKYLDDDHEWVVMVCDADWHECLDVSWSSGCNMIRLLVHDISVILGSSCESSGE